MSNELPETRNHEILPEPRDNDISKAQKPPQLHHIFEGKELYNGLELDSVLVSRERYFTETSTAIAPEVISTNIIPQDASSINTMEKNSQVAELAVGQQGEESGLDPRGIGTRWKSKTIRNTLIVVVVFIIVVLVAILLGVFLGRKHGNSASAVDQFDILDVSKLSALVFQNGENGTDKSVFFQISPSLAIMRARWNSTTTGWTFENVSQAMIEGSSSIYPKAGTPLVAVAPDAVDQDDLSNFWVDLYFMSVSNHPYQIWSWSLPQTGESKDQLWHQESLQNYQVIFTTGFAEGTQLAAYRDQCAANCSNESRMLYQGANGDLMLGTSPVYDWQVWNITDISGVSEPMLPALEMNSSIAVTRYSPGPGIEPSGMRMYYDVSHRLEEYFLIDGNWTHGRVLPPGTENQVHSADITIRRFRGISR